MDESGELRVDGSLDENVDTCKFKLTGILVGRKDYAEVQVRIVKARKPPEPLFMKSVYVGDVFSDAVKPHLVLNVERTDNQTEVKILGAEPENCGKMFKISSSGDVSVDDTIKDDVPLCTFKVEATKDKRTEEAKVIVHIVKKLPRPEPLFKRSVYVAEVLSDQKPGHLVLDVETVNEKVNITAETEQATCEQSFKVDEAGNLQVNGPLDLNVVTCKFKLTGILDDRKDYAEVQVRIVKALTPPEPLFKKSVYVGDVYSDAVKPHLVLNVERTNDTIEVNSLGAEPEDCKKMFLISKSGDVLVDDTIKDNVPLCTFTVEATKNKREEEAKVIVHILKKLDPLFPKSLYSAELMSNTKVGTVLLEVKTLEVVTVVLSGHPAFGLNDKREIYLKEKIGAVPSQHQLVLKGTLGHRHEEAKVHLSIVESEHSLQSIFTKSKYSVVIRSIVEANENVFTLKLLNSSLQVTLTATGGDLGFLELDSNSLNIKSKVPLVQTDKEYRLEVTATTSQPGAKTDITEVFIQVVMPVFSKNKYLVDLARCSSLGSVIFRDFLLRSDPTISIAGGDTEFFKYNEKDKSIILLKELDAKDQYELILQGKSSSNSDLADRTTVIFEVSPCAECGLVDKTNVLVNVSEGKVPGDEVHKIIANKKATFVAEDGDLDYFEVNLNDGTIKAKLPLLLTYYELQVKVDSTDDPRLQVSVWVLFRVEISRPYSRIFTKDKYIAEFSAGDVSKNVFTVETVPPNKTNVSMSLKNHLDTFELGEKDGNLKLLKSVEDGAKYELDVEATANTPKPHKDETKVIVQAQKIVVSNPSFFSKCVFTAYVQRGFTMGEKLLEVRNDKSPPAKYSLLQHNDLFILSDEGMLTLKVDFAGLTEQVYYLKMYAVESKHYQSLTYKISDTEVGEALAVITKDVPPEFVDSNPLIKLFLPSPFLVDYTFEIMLKNHEDGDKFTVIKQEPEGAVAIDAQSGKVYFRVDITADDGWSSKCLVQVERRNGLKSALDLVLIKLKEDNLIAFKSVVDLAEAQANRLKYESEISAVLNFTFKIVHMGSATDSKSLYGEHRHSRMRREPEAKTKMIGAALDKEVMEFKNIKNQLVKVKEEIHGIIGAHTVEEYESPDNDKASSPPATDLQGAVIALGVILGLLLLAICFFLFLATKKPELLEKINRRLKQPENEGSKNLFPASNGTSVSTVKNKGEGMEAQLEDSDEDEVGMTSGTPVSQRPLVATEPRIHKAEILDLRVSLDSAKTLPSDANYGSQEFQNEPQHSSQNQSIYTGITDGEYNRGYVLEDDGNINIAFKTNDHLQQKLYFQNSSYNSDDIRQTPESPVILQQEADYATGVNIQDNANIYFGEDEILPDVVEALANPLEGCRDIQSAVVNIPEEDYEGPSGDPGSTPHIRKKQTVKLDLSISKETEDGKQGEKEPEKENVQDKELKGEDEEAKGNEGKEQIDDEGSGGSSDDDAAVKKKSVVSFSDTLEVIHL